MTLNLQSLVDALPRDPALWDSVAIDEAERVLADLGADAGLGLWAPSKIDSQNHKSAQGLVAATFDSLRLWEADFGLNSALVARHGETGQVSASPLFPDRKTSRSPRRRVSQLGSAPNEELSAEYTQVVPFDVRGILPTRACGHFDLRVVYWDWVTQPWLVAVDLTEADSHRSMIDGSNLHLLFEINRKGGQVQWMVRLKDQAENLQGKEEGVRAIAATIMIFEIDRPEPHLSSVSLCMPTEQPQGTLQHEYTCDLYPSLSEVLTAIDGGVDPILYLWAQDCLVGPVRMTGCAPAARLTDDP